MREFNCGGHKLRRSSFSNTLVELPEVEESENVEESPRRISDRATTSFKLLLLPPNSNEEIVPSHRPRFNTIPEGVTERPKCLDKTKSMLIDTKFIPMREKQTQRHRYPRRMSLFHSLDSQLAGPHKPNDNFVTNTSGHSGLVVSPIHKSSETVIPKPDSRGIGIEASSVSAFDINMISDNDMMNKNSDVVKWRKALNKAKIESPYRSMDNFTKSIVNDEDFRSRRRFSMPLDSATWDRRMTHPAFEDTSRKVDILLRYGKALRERYHHDPANQKKSVPKKTARTLADLTIEMPKKPRFSSFLSPEAQYSILKGYEDRLYRKLSCSLPEYDPPLKRTITPKNTNADNKHNNSLGFFHDSGYHNVNVHDTRINGDDRLGGELKMTSSSFLTQAADDKGSNLQLSPSTVATDSLSIDSDAQGPDHAKTVMRSLRRLSISLGKDDRSSIYESFDGRYADDDDICSMFTPRQRSHSMPSVSNMPFQRRLRMSHRLQSAMDILDNIDCEQDSKLIPKLKAKRSNSLAEYNSWVSEWNKEFYLNNSHS